NKINSMEFDNRKATKRNAGEMPTPRSGRPESKRLLETTHNLHDLIKQLGAQLPDNDLVKQLKGAMDDHLQQLNGLLEAVSHLESPEEKERKRSLVVIGLAEPTSEKASERVRADFTAVNEILDLLDVAAAPTAIYRLGHPNPNRFPDRPRKGPRVVKIVMPSSGIQRQVLAALRTHRGKLKENSQYNRCIIRPSMTAEERELDKAAQAELKRRKIAGEKYLFIKNHQVYSRDPFTGDL
ncbi:MAG TPA: hypothetical protein VFV08_14050, partial [Puia sp.]|nr:hypothetical protein [Puia sp.]